MSEEKKKSGRPPMPPAKGEYGAGGYGAGGYGEGGPKGGPGQPPMGMPPMGMPPMGMPPMGMPPMGMPPMGMPPMGMPPMGMPMMGMQVMMMPVIMIPMMPPMGQPPMGQPPMGQPPMGMPPMPPMGGEKDKKKDRPEPSPEEKIKLDKGRILEFLSLIDEILIMQAAKILAIPKPVIGKMVEELEEKELLGTKPSTEYEGKKIIFITEKGKEQVEEKRAEFLKRIKEN